MLLRIQKEQDPSIAFRFACRVNMCGSCGMVINGREGLACKTNVCDLPARQNITLRPLNHFPVIKDLVVDMGPFFAKYEDALPFFEPREKRDEPYVIKPDDQNRVDIGMATDCIACGCCASSCTMVDSHEGYCGPAALNRAFTCRTEFNRAGPLVHEFLVRRGGNGHSGGGLRLCGPLLPHRPGQRPANPHTVRTMSEHIDVGVTGLLQREYDLNATGDKLLDMMIRTYNGRNTSAEALGHREFVMTRLYESA